MKQKGFTLLELLAVIVILAIIALITVPIIMNVVESSRKSSATSSAYGYIDGVKIMYAKEMLSGSDFTLEGTFNVNEEGKLDGHDVEVEGTKAKGGYLTYSNGKITKGCLTIGDYKVTIENDTAKETIKGACDNGVPQAKSFADDSWETIIANVKAGTTDVYEVGDTKEVTLTSEDEEIAGTYTLRIANKSTPNECLQEDFSQTACGFVVEFEDIITTHVMNLADSTHPYGTNVGGWPDTELYNYLKNDIYDAFPEELKKGIKNTKVIAGYGKDDTDNFETMDKLYLLSPHEVFENGDDPDNTVDYDEAWNKTRQLDYYKGVTTDDTKDRKKVIKEYNDIAEYWWLRSACSNGNDFFYRVYNGIDWFRADAANGIHGVAPAFRIG